jgi:DNA mismatch repair protein MutL
VESAATLDRAPALPQLRQPVSVTSPTGAEAGQLAFFVPAREPGNQTALPTPDTEAPIEPPPPTRLWQLHDSYILAETRTGLLIIDQHSAHERILFEELMRGFGNGGANSQRLLFPLTLRLAPAEFAVVTDSAELLRSAGYEIEPFGGRTIIVHGAPAPHPYFNAERCLREMLAELAAGSELTRAAHNQHERIGMTFACKGAIKAGQRLSEREMSDLFERLFATELPYHDVHGRATVVRLSLTELERRFGRHG